MRVQDTRFQADDAEIRERVRALVQAHGTLVGERWDAQADHAERVVGEIIDSQGLAAGRLWAAALGDELRAEIERAGIDREGRVVGPPYAATAATGH
jgi:hypothetical protein